MKNCDTNSFVDKWRNGEKNHEILTIQNGNPGRPCNSGKYYNGTFSPAASFCNVCRNPLGRRFYFGLRVGYHAKGMGHGCWLVGISPDRWIWMLRWISIRVLDFLRVVSQGVRWPLSQRWGLLLAPTWLSTWWRTLISGGLPAASGTCGWGISASGWMWWVWALDRMPLRIWGQGLGSQALRCRRRFVSRHPAMGCAPCPGWWPSLGLSVALVHDHHGIILKWTILN